MRRFPALIVLISMLGLGMVLAETPISKKAPASRTGLVTVINIAGTVKVTGWDEGLVEVKGSLSDERLALEFKSEGERTSIEVEYPRQARNFGGEADLVIHVPRGCRLEVQTVSADILVQDMKGDISLQSVNGDLIVEGGSGAMEVQNVSGDIKARKLGEITKGEFQTVSGNLDLQGPFAKNAKVEADTVSGEITIRAAGTLAADWKVSTFSGSIDNQIGPAENGDDEDEGPGHDLEFTTNGGGARLIINTFSGDISLLK